MTLLLKQLFAFIKLLNSDKGTNQIAAGLACGLILGFAPFFSLQTVLVIVLMLFFRIQIGAATLSAFFFAFPAYLFDPIFHKIGSKVLETPALNPVFTQLYNLPIVPFTKFYNSVVMGAGVTSILLFPLVFLLGRTFVTQYRVQVVARMQETKAWKAVKATGFYKWYVKYDDLYGSN